MIMFCNLCNSTAFAAALAAAWVALAAEAAATSASEAAAELGSWRGGAPSSMRIKLTYLTSVHPETLT